MDRTIYVPIYKGSLMVRYRGRKIYSVEYIDRKKFRLYDDVVSMLFKRYASGEKVSFDKLVIDTTGLTRFQVRVYNKVREIPYGEVRTYKWVSNELGIGSPRAVGQALKRNPFLIVVPCHRVVRADGDIGGFTSIGGIDLKKFLLKLEGSL